MNDFFVVNKKGEHMEDLAHEALSALVKTRNTDTDRNFKDTPKRVEKMFEEFIWKEEKIEEEIDALFQENRIFPSSYQGMITMCNIKAVSVCPHHLLPVALTVHIGYIPKVGNDTQSQVIGASKLARLAVLMGKRPFLQEEYTENIAQTLLKKINAEGVGVVVSGRHGCISTRGAKQANAVMGCSVMLGNFKENYDTRQEFLFQIEEARYAS